MATDDCKDFLLQGGGNCPTEDSIKVVTVDGTPGVQGLPGDDGVGITNTTLTFIDKVDGVSNYELVIDFTNGNSVVAGTISIEDGDDGTNGIDGSSIIWRNTWTSSPNPSYSINDVVYFQGSSYIALVDNPILNPGQSPNQWGIVALKGETGQIGASGAADSILAKASNSIGQAVASNTATKLVYDNTDFQQDYNGTNIHNSSVNNSRFTAPTEGVYLFNASVYVDDLTEGSLVLKVKKNNTSYIAYNIHETDDTDGALLDPETLAINITAVDFLIEGDYLELEVTTTSPDPITVRNDDGYSWASMGRWTSKGDKGIKGDDGADAPGLGGEISVASSGGTATFNAVSSYNQTIILTEDTTMNVIGMVDGSSMQIRVVQDAIGGWRLFAPGGSFVENSPSTEVYVTGMPSREDIITVFYNGAKHIVHNAKEIHSYHVVFQNLAVDTPPVKMDRDTYIYNISYGTGIDGISIHNYTDDLTESFPPTLPYLMEKYKEYQFLPVYTGGFTSGTVDLIIY